MTKRARDVQPGDRLRVASGDVIKVLCSNPETRSSASGSTSAWHIEGYAPGRPTWRSIGDPDSLMEVVG